jgi:hypothetical protein
VPTPENYDDFAGELMRLAQASEILIAPATAAMGPDVLRGGVLTPEVIATLVTVERGATLCASETANASHQCLARAAICRQCRLEWQSFHRAMAAWAASATAASDPPASPGPPPTPPAPPPAWCQI